MQKFLVSGLVLSALAAPALAQAPAPTTGTGSESSASPGTGTTPTSSATVEAKKEEPLRFYGFGLDFSLYDSSNLNTAYYANSIDYWLLPSFQLGQLAFKGTRFENMMITGRFIMNSHLAGYDEESFDPNTNNAGYLQPCSNLTPSSQGGTINPADVQRCNYDPGARRTTYSDVTLGVSVPRLVTIPVLDVSVSPGLSVILPASRTSRYATLRSTVGASVGLGRAFFEGKLKLSYSFGASKSFHEFSTSQASGSASSAPGGETINGEILSTIVGPNAALFNNSPGYANNSWGMSHIFRVEVTPIEKLSLGVLYWLRQSFKYDLSCSADYGNLQNVPLCDNGAKVAVGSDSGITPNNATVASQTFAVTAGYQVLDYLNLSIALFTTTPQKRPDNSYRQPFISVDPNGYSSVSVGATFSLEKAAARLF